MQSNQALANTLAGAFQNLRYQRVTTVRISKFCGPPKRSGDQTLGEWLTDVDAYARQVDLSHAEKLSTALDFLGGNAKEEVLCTPSDDRGFPKLKALLVKRFGSPETVQTLTRALYSRSQLSGESLTDFSRSLIRLHDHIEAAAANAQERDDLAKLRENTLKEQFVKGVAELAVRRELRRMQVEKPGLDFFKFREHALSLFPEGDGATTRRSKVRLLQGADDDWVQPIEINATAAQSSDVIGAVTKNSEKILEKLDVLATKQAATADQIQNLTSVLSQKLDAAIASHRPYGTCNYCKKPGHFAKD